MNNRKTKQQYITAYWLTIPDTKILLAQLPYMMYNCNNLIIKPSISLGEKSGGV